MFGRGKNQEQDPGLMDEVYGAVPGYAPQAAAQQPEALYQGDGREYWEEVEDPRLANGKPFRRIADDGTVSYHTAGEYQNALGLTDEDILQSAGHRPDPRLKHLDDLMARFGNGQPTANESDDDDAFEIEIEELKGLKIKGRGSLQRLLQGDPAPPQQPSLIDQYLMQRMAGGFVPTDVPYMPAEHATPWDGQQYTQPQITEEAYGVGQWDDANTEDAAVQPYDSGWGTQGDELYPQQAYGQPEQPWPIPPEATAGYDTGARQETEEADNPPETPERDDYTDKDPRRARQIGKTVLRRARKIGVIRLSKIAAASVIVLAGPSIVYNGIPTSPTEAIADAVITGPKLVGDTIGLVNTVRAL